VRSSGPRYGGRSRESRVRKLVSPVRPRVFAFLVRGGGVGGLLGTDQGRAAVDAAPGDTQAEDTQAGDTQAGITAAQRGSFRKILPERTHKQSFLTEVHASIPPTQLTMALNIRQRHIGARRIFAGPCCPIHLRRSSSLL